jgi:hypothetical protein
MMTPLPLAPVLLLAALTFLSSDTDLTTLTTKAAENYRARESLSNDFTYTESFRNLNFNSRGKTILDVGDTFNVIFLEGRPYFRRIEHNGKPLSPKDDQQEQKKAENVARARKSGDRNAGAYPHAITLKLPIDELPTAFDLMAQEDTMLNGRKTVVIEAMPSSRYNAARGNDQLVSVLRMILWIDQQDFQIAKVKAEVIKEGTRYHPGTIIEAEYVKVREEVWLMSRFHFKGVVNDGSGQVGVEAEQKCYDYRKFVADSRIVEE